MHVLCLIDSLVGSGAERSLAGLVTQFVARGVTVDVAYLSEAPGLQGAIEESGATLFNLAGRGRRIAGIRRARRLIASRRPDLVHTTLFEANLAGRVAARLEGVPVVSTLAAVSYGPEHRAAPHLDWWKVREAHAVDAITARSVRRFHAVASHVADVMAARLRVPRERIDVVPRGRDPRELGDRNADRREVARARLGLGREDRLVLAASRHDARKGLDVLLNAFGRLRSGRPQLTLALAGAEGSQTIDLRRAAARLSLDGAARFLGSRTDVPELMCAADAFVLPSRTEGFPGALLEAMALEAPIVATDIPAVREAVGSDGVALLVPPNDPGRLAEAIGTTLDDSAGASLRARLARSRFLTHFTIDRIADEMLAFYDRALATDRGRQ